MKKQSNKLTSKNTDKEAKYWEENFDDAWTKGESVKTKAAPDLSQTITVSLKPSIAKAV